MQLIQNRTWLPTSTEVLTDDGWLPITDITFAHSIMGYKNSLFTLSNVTQVNKYDYNGMISKGQNDKALVKAKSIDLPYKLLRKGVSFELPKMEKVPYKGMLINLVTSNNTMVVRCLNGRGHNNDYLICSCLK